MNQICFQGKYFSVISTNCFSSSKVSILLLNKRKDYLLSYVHMEPGSSGSIVSDYGLDDRGSIPGGGLCVQTGSGAHPASCTMGTGGPFPGGKARLGRDANHSPPSSAEVVNE
jgi:hypothetical protein